MGDGLLAVFVSVATLFGALLRSSPQKNASHFALDGSPLSNTGEFVMLIIMPRRSTGGPEVSRGHTW